MVFYFDTKDANGVPTLVCWIVFALVLSFITHFRTRFSHLRFCVVLEMEDVFAFAEEKMNNLMCYVFLYLMTGKL